MNDEGVFWLPLVLGFVVVQEVVPVEVQGLGVWSRQLVWEE